MAGWGGGVENTLVFNELSMSRPPPKGGGDNVLAGYGKSFRERSKLKKNIAKEFQSGFENRDFSKKTPVWGFVENRHLFWMLLLYLLDVSAL